MFRKILLSAAALAIAGCATTAATVPLEKGKFVAFDCEGQDFQARLSAEGNSVRVRSHHGAAELSPAGAGQYRGDGFVLYLAGEHGVALEHGGKIIGKRCKRA